MNFKKYHVSKNLFDEIYPDLEQGQAVKYKPIFVGDGDFTLSTDCPLVQAGAADLFLLPGNVSSGAGTVSHGVYFGQSRTFFSVGGYVTIGYRKYSATHPLLSDYHTMLNTGSTPQPYEPYSSEVWHDIPYYQHKTATDTLTLPAVIYPNDTSVTVGIKGNTTQSGTPSPQSPVDVDGVGEMSSNLADLYGVSKRALSLDFTTTDNMRIVIDGTKSSGANVISIKTPNIVVPVGTYTVKLKMTGGTITGLTDGVFFGINQNTYGQRTAPAVAQVGDVGTRTFTLSEDTTISSFDITPGYGSSVGVFDNATFECWFYAGSDDKPYEPYGYKIPILTNSTTNNVYLGEVQTVRQIKKYKFTGQETFSRTISSTETGTSVYSIRYDAIGMENIIDYNQLMPHITYPFFFCSHFVMKTNTSFDTPYTAIKNGEIGANSVANNTYNRYVIFASNQYNTVDTFQAFLAQQYANGTPVTVWYVLATPETAVVNEPLMKIGSYSDSLTTSIPVTAGENSLDVQTTVAPSEVAAGFSGWHAVSAAHERENGQWD